MQALEELKELKEMENEAEYALERAVPCPRCEEMIQSLQVVRLLRTKVNFTSNLPRRGCVVICPACSGLISANIGSRMI